MRQAWQQGTEAQTQPVNALLGANGEVVLSQNAPRVITQLADGSLGLSRQHTTITIIQQPTPLPTVAPPEPQDSRIQTVVNGVDHIETKAILPERLAVEQLEAIKQIADNGTLIAQQRFAVEQYKINSDAQLEWLRIVKSFTLQGFLCSIPFVFAVYWVVSQAVKGWLGWKKEKFAHERKELEIAERINRE